MPLISNKKSISTINNNQRMWISLIQQKLRPFLLHFCLQIEMFLFFIVIFYHNMSLFLEIVTKNSFLILIFIWCSTIGIIRWKISEPINWSIKFIYHGLRFKKLSYFYTREENFVQKLTKTSIQKYTAICSATSYQNIRGSWKKFMPL